MMEKMISSLSLKTPKITIKSISGLPCKNKTVHLTVKNIIIILETKLLSIATNLPYHQPQGFQIFSNKIQRLKTYVLAQKDSTTKSVYSVNKEGKVEENDFLKTFVIDNKDGCQKYNSARTLSSTHGGSFIDLNMDCRPDLVLETNEAGKRIVEIYYYRDAGFCLVDSNTFNDDNIMDSSSISFTDIARKGSNDAVIVRQKNLDGKNKLFIHVFLNKHVIKVDQEKLCSNKEGSEKDKPLAPFEPFNVKSNVMTKVISILKLELLLFGYQF